MPVLRVVIAAGGTAGHVVPALAVADALAEAGAQVSFMGTRERAEASLVPAAGYEIDFLAVRGIDRRNPIRAAGALARAAAAVRVARRLLRARRADVVMGGGGYVAAPAGLAALSLGLPIVLTEADSHLGLANRLLAPRAERVCLAFGVPGREGERYVLTGRPVPAAILNADRSAARERYGIAAGDRCVLIFGGSLGARTINLAAAEAFGPANTDARRAARDFHVLHIAGSRDYLELTERLEGAEHYTLLEYEPDLGDALAASDLVLARSGGSVFELTAAGRPAILVPYPFASAGHQHANAAWMEEAGAARVVEDSEVTPERLTAEIAHLLDDPERLAAMAAASLALARPDAAVRIADEILQAGAA
ncbi:MAG: undecaprenyldiphospho-muramoylpentapeptide beta-N-acetylglucosaminyltransferase [Solirubrobacterales bacterium]